MAFLSQGHLSFCLEDMSVSRRDAGTVSRAAALTRMPRRLAPGQQTPENKLLHLFGPWMAPTSVNQEARRYDFSEGYRSMTNTAIRWYIPEEWVSKHAQPIPTHANLLTPEDEHFWPTYAWTDNPWIVDQYGKPLTSQKYDKIQPCSNANLQKSSTDYCSDILLCHSNDRI